MKKDILFKVRHMHKVYGPTIALENVDFNLKRGEIRGLVGENGSGKSTIMSIASGMQPPTKGEMIYKGKEWRPDTMVEAQEAGISMILQEANTIPNVTVAQNIFSGHEKTFSKYGFFNLKKMTVEAQKSLDEFDISHIKAKDSINKYSYEDRKLIEIVRCVKDHTQILVVDETTTALSMEGRVILYRIMQKMAKDNKAVVFISHDMDEILEQCTVVTVLRDGEVIGDITNAEIMSLKKDDRIYNEILKKARYMMVGREIGEKYYREDYESTHSGKVIFEMKNVTVGQVKNFSLKIHAGEIVGFGGLSGCGMHEIGRAAFGIEKIQRGEVLFKGEQIKNPLTAIKKNMAYISKNRDTEALILEGSISDNISLPSLDDLVKHTFINPRDEKELVANQIDRFSIKCHGGKQWVRTLSGGNKQKVSFAKWTAKDSKLFIMDCPTRGVDVGVKQAMYTLIEDMKRQGKGILMISEELSELIGMSDRLIIMKDFKCVKEFQRSKDLKETDIIEYML